MRLPWQVLAPCLALAALPPSAPRAPLVPEVRMGGDAAMEAEARKAMASQDPALRAQTLQRLTRHRFKHSKAPEKEYCLFAQGMLQAAAGDVRGGAVPLRKLERGWPQSALLPEAQLVLAEEAQQFKRYREAETRLQKTLDSDLSPTLKRRAQELLLWGHVLQNRPEAGLALLPSLHPLGTEAPSERGLAALAIVQCSANDREAASQLVMSYRKAFPQGPSMPKVHLAWGRHLGALGEARASAETFRKLLQEHPRAPEADEARLALATLLAEGKLPAHIAKAFPSPAQLLKGLDGADPQGNVAAQRTLVRLRLALKEGKIQEAMAHAEALDPATWGATALALALRAEAFRAYVREQLQAQQPGAVLPYLDPSHLEGLSADLRLQLAVALLHAGLPEAAVYVKSLSPSGEQAALTRALAEATLPPVPPETLAQLLPPRPGDAIQALRMAQAAAARQDCQALARLLPRAKPGPERVELVGNLLRRPGVRSSEAEGWLARAPEKGMDRMPLAVFVADLRARRSDWKGALSLYPTDPPAALRGWVALQRATALFKLGQRDAARTILDAHTQEASFRTERETLAKRLTRE